MYAFPRLLQDADVYLDVFQTFIASWSEMANLKGRVAPLKGWIRATEKITTGYTSTDNYGVREISDLVRGELIATDANAPDKGESLCKLLLNFDAEIKQAIIEANKQLDKKNMMK